MICIVDSNKHPLENLANKVNHVIGKFEDLRMNREMIANKSDLRIGHSDELEFKVPTY